MGDRCRRLRQYRKRPNSFIGGGVNHVASGIESTIGGGLLSTASGSAATIGGGASHTASGINSTVGGGWINMATATYSTIGGGRSNEATQSDATIGGGISNTASSISSTVGGGYYNTASGYASTVAGWFNAASGNLSFVAGRNADDLGNNNSFVWGGASGARTSAGSDTFNVWSTAIYLNGSTSLTSDRSMKEAFSFVSARDVLDKVVEMPVTSWRFKSEDDSVRHIGPMAQDFMAAFGYGVSDTHITATDADGVALASIQALYELHQEKDAKLAEQAEVNTALRWHNAQLEARLARLEKAILRESEPAPTGTD